MLTMPKQFDPQTDISSLNGKVILITGGSAGIGEATVRALAQHDPACIYLCARKLAAGEAIIKSIHAIQPKANIVLLPLDLASFESIRACASAFNAQSDRLDILFLNAGISTVAPAVTKDGYEIQFGTNHMGHALLTQLLLPQMLETQRREPQADLRIHVTASVGASSFRPKAGLQLHKMKQAEPGWHPITTYGHSKYANVLFARQLTALYPAICTTSSHPGTVRSSLWERADGAKWLNRTFGPLIRATGVNTAEGAKNQLWCATAPRDQVLNGGYYLPIGKLSEKDAGLRDQESIDRLWEWTNEELAAHGASGWPKAVGG
jgi:NAD(P)-dependent dehydrogenase (short-subunit alcohol dehydrogenase family)